MHALDKLKEANDAYHVAANRIFRLKLEDVTCDSTNALTNIKAKFGSYHDNVFHLMSESRALLEPIFGGDD